MSEIQNEFQEARDMAARCHFARANEYAQNNDFVAANMQVRAANLAIENDREGYLNYTHSKELVTYDTKWTQLLIT